MRYFALISSVLIIVCLQGCKKSTVKYASLASLNVVNVSVNLGTVKVNFSDLKGVYSSISTTVAYSANTPYSVNAGVTVPVTIVPSADTNTIAFSGKFNLADAGVYSFYLAGQASKVDTLLVKENIPAFADSACGVRFINLSYNSNPIIVTLSTTPAVTEFSSLAYGQSSGFRKYAALSTNGTYVFQVRDAGTSNILASYTLTTPRFFSITLIWKGMTGATGTNAPGIMRVNHY